MYNLGKGAQQRLKLYANVLTFEQLKEVVLICVGVHCSPPQALQFTNLILRRGMNKRLPELTCVSDPGREKSLFVHISVKIRAFYVLARWFKATYQALA